MTPPGFLLAASGIAALLALVLSFTAENWGRRLAIAALWLAIATVPCSLAWDIAYPPAPGEDPSARATPLGATLSHLTNYGVAVMPGAGIAMVALRRARIASSKRGERA